MQAAESVGIQIPSMCFMKGYTNHPSCMICMVKEKNSGKLFASCAMPVAEGMELISDDEEVRDARREALELLLSDHIGDCEAPCRNGCPAFMDIPLMNRLIAAGKFREALKVVKEEIALPLILGYICEAPCEKVCRRAPIDQAVSICQLKKFVAADDLDAEDPYLPSKLNPKAKKVAIVGAGPAGLSAAFFLLRKGYRVSVYDKNNFGGGTLLSLEEDVLPEIVRQREIDYLISVGMELQLNSSVDADMLENKLKPDYDAVLLATGDLGENDNKKLGILFDAKGFLVDKLSSQTNMQGVFACGSAVRKQKMAIRTVAQGKEVAMAMDQYLSGEEVIPGKKMFNSRFGKLKPEEEKEYLTESVPDSRMNPEKGILDGFTKEEASLEAQRCMRCDCRKTVSCKLRIYSHEYKADRKKYLAGDRKILTKQFNHHNIVYESEKCIKCGICVEITSKEKELTGLSFIGRGFDVRVDVPMNRTLDDALTKTAARCAEACPTGAISFLEGERDPAYAKLLTGNKKK